MLVRSIRWALLVAVSAATAMVTAQQADRPDLVLTNATIWPGTDAAWSSSRIVVVDGRIAPPGTKPGAGAVIVDLGGAFLMPGLQDAHGHLLGLGQSLERVDLVGTKSFAEVVERLRAVAEHRQPGSWIVGRGWDQNDWPDKSMPHHSELSAATPDHPVWLVRIDGHAGLANHRAMHIAGVKAGQRAPDGGEVLRGANGEPSGVFVDTAMGAITRAMPEEDAETVRRQLLAAQQHCFEQGLTCVHDAGVGADTYAILEDLHATGRWRLRTYAMYSASERAAIERGPLRTADDLLQVRAVKGYVDGALGSYGAALLEPYSDRPKFRGLKLTPTAGVRELGQFCADHGMQLCVHAIGDAGNRAVLDAFAEVDFPDGRQAARFRIEHCQVVHPADQVRFVALGVVPSMQPTHLTSDMPWAPRRLGPDRIPHAYAWRSFHALGLPVAFGSDFPVESADPRRGIFAAVTTRQEVGAAELRPDQKLGRVRALQGFTRDAAFAMFAETELGRIAVGARADLTVFDRNLLECSEEGLLQARVRMTVVDGRIVFDAAAAR
jgi:predicted amidohydrolase YtcJ